MTNKVDPHRPVRFVNIGNLAGAELAVSAATLRSTRDPAVGARHRQLPDGAHAAGRRGHVRRGRRGPATVDFVERPLSEVESAWDLPERLVLVP